MTHTQDLTISLILDEIGLNWLFVIQHYGSSFSMRRLKSAVGACIKASPRHVVLMDVDPEVSLVRMRQRAGIKTGFPTPDGHYDALTDDEALEINRNRYSAIQGIANGVSELDSNTILRIDGRLSPQEIAEIMLDWIQNNLN